MEYYVRVTGYNGPGGENSSSNSSESFTTYGASTVAAPFPVMTVAQVYLTSGHAFQTKSSINNHIHGDLMDLT